jgi:putative flippase GtrA
MSATLLLPLRELVAFSIVGFVATVVHYGVVVLLVPLGIEPLAANVAGFLVAFVASFVGHDRWTFPAARRARGHALRRFFAVASLSFCANELLYEWLLRNTALSYRAALIVVLLAVGAATLSLSKLWAFRDAHT